MGTYQDLDCLCLVGDRERRSGSVLDQRRGDAGSVGTELWVKIAWQENLGKASEGKV